MHQAIKQILAEHRLMGLTDADFTLDHTVIDDQVKELDIRYTKTVNTLPSRIFKITSLNILRLSNISNLPDEISKLTELRLLELNRLQSPSLNPFVTELVKLEILIIKRSKLLSLPFSLDKLSNLRDVDLINNDMSKVPEILLTLPNLSYLSLAGFDDTVNEFTVKLEQLQHLNKLFIGKFTHEIFPAIWVVLSELHELTHITISGYASGITELMYIPPLINNLTNLEFLWIDGSIVCFPDIPDLDNLKELYLFATPLHNKTKQILESKQGICINPSCPIHST